MKDIYNINRREKQITDIMDFFDFHKVAKVMDALNWQWAHKSPDGPLDEYESWVPDEPEIRQFARRLMEECFDSEEKQIAEHPEVHYAVVYSGGFKAEIWDGVMSLSFVVAHWESDDIE